VFGHLTAEENHLVGAFNRMTRAGDKAGYRDGLTIFTASGSQGTTRQVSVRRRLADGGHRHGYDGDA
jgi:hypothetical protein